MESILSNKLLNGSGYYPLSDCDLLHFTHNCPANQYELSDCSQCPFNKESGNDYFQMDEYYTMPIKDVVRIIMEQVRNRVEKE